MARRPPRHTDDRRGPRRTADLPDTNRARRTWTGPPYQRTPGRWSGTVDFGGRKHHVGTFDTPRAWGRARDELLLDLQLRQRDRGAPTSELGGMTVREFVGEPGSGWPWGFDNQGRRVTKSTFEHHEQCIRALVRDFGDRPLIGGITRTEATAWVQTVTENQATSAIAMFNDAVRIDANVASPFVLLSRRRTRGRRELDGILTEAEIRLLQEVACELHPDPYGLVLAAMFELAATTGARPGEMRAMTWDRFKPETGEIRIQFALSKHGTFVAPKYNSARTIVVEPEVVQRIAAMPRISDTMIFPTKTGRLMSQSSWAMMWGPIRNAFTARLDADHWLCQRIANCEFARQNEPDEYKRARMPQGRLDLYELRHRACTRMVTPAPHGLGIHPADAAYMVGHKDGGRLIEEVYVHRNPEAARERIHAAMRGVSSQPEKC